jgi:hypothetical protein
LGVRAPICASAALETTSAMAIVRSFIVSL